MVNIALNLSDVKKESAWPILEFSKCLNLNLFDLIYKRVNINISH